MQRLIVPTRSPSAAPRGRPVRAAVPALVLAASVLNACYVNVPVTREPVGGAVVALQLNDRGRVAMENVLGPSVDRVEGAVVRGTADEYVLSVSTVATLDGNSSKWTGEQVTLRREFVRLESERRFSRGRTLAAVTASALAIGAFVLTRTLGGRGSEEPDTKPKPPTGEPTRQLVRVP